MRLEMTDGAVIYGHVVRRTDSYVHVVAAGTNQKLPLETLSPGTQEKLRATLPETGTIGSDDPTRATIARLEQNLRMLSTSPAKRRVFPLVDYGYGVPPGSSSFFVPSRHGLVSVPFSYSSECSGTYRRGSTFSLHIDL